MARARVPVRKVRSSRRDGRLIFMSLLADMVTVGGWPQLGEVSEGSGRARLCASAKHSTLNDPSSFLMKRDELSNTACRVTLACPRNKLGQTRLY